MDKILIISPNPIFSEEIKSILGSEKKLGFFQYLTSGSIDFSVRIIKSTPSIELLIVDDSPPNKKYLQKDIVETEKPILVISDQYLLKIQKGTSSFSNFRCRLHKNSKSQQIRDMANLILSERLHTGGTDIYREKSPVSSERTINITEREKQVLTFLIKGHSNDEISKLLRVKECTIKAHLSNLMKKFSVSNRTQLTFQVKIENSKSNNQLRSEILDKIQFKGRLTNREVEIMKLVATGSPNKIISHELDIQEATVKKHISNIFRKLHINNRTQLSDLIIK